MGKEFACRAIAFIVLASPSNTFSRTVEPVTYSYPPKTDPVDVYETTAQNERQPDGYVYEYEQQQESPSEPAQSIANHPSILAHHYYDKPTTVATAVIPPTIGTEATRDKKYLKTVTKAKKPRNENAYISKVSYAAQRNPYESTTTNRNYESPVHQFERPEPSVRKVLVQKKTRRLNPPQEIPVNEDVVKESQPVTTDSEDESSTKKPPYSSQYTRESKSRNNGNFTSDDSTQDDDYDDDRGRTTAMPKYKRVHDRKQTRKKPKSETSNGLYESAKYEDAASETSSPTDDDAEEESIAEPARHRDSESVKYVNTNEVDGHITREDFDYPPDESTEIIKLDFQDQPEREPEESFTIEKHSVKMLRKPLRYAYSSDLRQSATDDHREDGKKDGEDESHKKGSGEKRKSGHHESEDEKKSTKYESEREFDKGKKGHKEKEDRKKEHHEEKGKKKKHNEERGHYGEQNVAAEGKKEAEFGEDGKHKKGHSTKGSHNVHKKNEFLKKHEFYDEHHENDEHKKYGDFHKGHKHKKGGKYKKSHKDDNYSNVHKGKKGKKHKGHKVHVHKGHKKKSGNEQHHEHDEKYGKKEGHKERKKWAYEKD